MAKKKPQPWPVGVKIEEIRYMNAEETRTMGWDTPGILILLDDGGVIFAMSDEEGNRAGVLMASQLGGPPELLHRITLREGWKGIR